MPGTDAKPIALTPKMLAMTRWIVLFRRRCGYSPTLGEIGQHFGVSKVTVFGHMRTLEKRGLMRIIPNAWRGTIPTDEAEGLTSRER